LIRGLNQLNVVDHRTVQVVNDKPRFDMLFSFRAPYRHGLAIQSRAAFDRLGPDQDGTQLTGTGPWKLIEVSPLDYWKLEAVEGHWREAPKFQELVLWQIPKESSRIASLKTGALDTAEVAPQSIDQLRKIPNMKFTRAPDAGQFAWHLHGQFYSTERPGYDPILPWVSADPDTGSEEWNRARKVRLAMALAIDRESLVREVLKGQGRAQHYWIDAGNTWLDPLKEAQPTPFKYDLTRAIRLLAEAGYPEGFDAEVACYPRGIPYEVEVCREIATKMWPAVGIKTRVNDLTYGDLRTDVLGRGLGLLAPHPLGTYTEPMALYPNGVWMVGSWNTGFEHPEIDALVAEALTHADSTQRAIPTRAIAEWIRDQVTHIPVYTPDLLYPAGPRIQPWQLQGGDKILIHNFEFIQSR
jgi:peptide/nickel transport system substrate-binding protein